MTQSPLKFYVIAYASGHKGNQFAYNLITKFPRKKQFPLEKLLAKIDHTRENPKQLKTF